MMPPERAWPHDSEMARLIRSYDWAATPLGPLDSWPVRLRSILDMLLGNAFPMAVLWTPDLIQIYNDAFCEILGERHPSALGESARVTWREVWPRNEALFARVFEGETLRFDDTMYPVFRNGRLVDAWFTVCYSPLRTEAGEVEAVLLTVIETTAQVRALITLRHREGSAALLAEISQDFMRLTTADEIMRAVGGRLGRHFRVARCHFADIDDTAGIATTRHDWHVPGVPGIAMTPQRLGDLFPEDLRAGAQRGDPIVVRDTLADSAASHEHAAALGMRAFIAVPLLKDGRWRFMICISDREPRDWRDDETELVREVATRLWRRIERARAEVALRASEERVRLVVDAIQDYAILTLDPRGRITSWNRGAEQVFGYSAAEALGQPASIIFTPDDRAAGSDVEEMRRAATTGRAEDERWYLRKGGEGLFVSGILFPLRAGGVLTGYVKVARDVTVRKRSEDELRRAHDELEERVRERTTELAMTVASLQSEVRDRRAAEEQSSRLFAQLVTAQEEERRRIAREIHDHVGQQMTALRMNLESLRAVALPNTLLANHTIRIQRIAEELDQSIDFLTSQLRPPSLDHLGLPVSLAQLVSGWAQQFGITADYEMSGMDDVRLPAAVETNLYRIAQEALHNVYKHAGADRVSVFLRRRADGVVLVIEDDGRGFDAATVANRRGEGGLGLLNMRERAALIGGELEIESAPGSGTTMFVRVPVADD